MAKPLMPKATAVWLVDNTALTFEQIADFCGLHTLEVKGIADGEVAQGIKGLDPVANGQLKREVLDAAQADPSKKLTLNKAKVHVPEPKKKGPRYTPVSRRQDRPDAIMWLLRHHPEIADPQIAKLIGTTKPTIQAVRDRTHWNTANLKPVDPVTLGLCTQMELDSAVQAAAAKRGRQAPAEAQADDSSLRPVDETLGFAQEQAPSFEPAAHSDEAVVENPAERGAEIEIGTPEDALDERVG